MLLFINLGQPLLRLGIVEINCCSAASGVRSRACCLWSSPDNFVKLSSQDPSLNQTFNLFRHFCSNYRKWFADTLEIEVFLNERVDRSVGCARFASQCL